METGSHALRSVEASVTERQLLERVRFLEAEGPWGSLGGLSGLWVLGPGTPRVPLRDPLRDL